MPIREVFDPGLKVDLHCQCKLQHWAYVGHLLRQTASLQTQTTIIKAMTPLNIAPSLQSCSVYLIRSGVS